MKARMFPVPGEGDDMALYNEVLSAPQIQQLANGASPLPIPEPSSLLLASLGVVALASSLYLHRKK